jgi:predicted nucleotidyltransferase
VRSAVVFHQARMIDGNICSALIKIGYRIAAHPHERGDQLIGLRNCTFRVIDKVGLYRSPICRKTPAFRRGLSHNPQVLKKSLNMPADKLATLNAIAEALQNVSNVVVVVLGGSYARGFARSDSDIDIGIYYRQASPCSVDQVRSIAERICTVGSVPIVTGMCEWGPWVNGGAWIQTPVGKVDFLYRNLDQVQVVIEEGQQGIWHRLRSTAAVRLSERGLLRRDVYLCSAL